MNDLLASLVSCPKWRRRKDARPAELLDAALHLFLEKGFAATRLEDVACRAGVSKGTVCSYYATKEDLFIAVVRSAIVPLVEEKALIAQRAVSAAERLRAVLQSMAASLADPRLGAIPKLITSEVGNFPDLARHWQVEVCDRFDQAVAGIIQDGIARGEFRPCDPKVMTELFVSPLLFHAINSHSLGRYETDPVDPQVLFTTHLDTFLRGIAAESRP